MVHTADRVPKDIDVLSTANHRLHVCDSLRRFPLGKARRNSKQRAQELVVSMLQQYSTVPPHILCHFTDPEATFGFAEVSHPCTPILFTVLYCWRIPAMTAAVSLSTWSRGN